MIYGHGGSELSVPMPIARVGHNTTRLGCTGRPLFLSWISAGARNKEIATVSAARKKERKQDTWHNFCSLLCVFFFTGMYGKTFKIFIAENRSPKVSQLTKHNERIPIYVHVTHQLTGWS